MVLSNSQIRKFQEIYLKTYGNRISREEAYDMGIKLINMMKIIYIPKDSEDYNNPKINV